MGATPAHHAIRQKAKTCPTLISLVPRSFNYSRIVTFIHHKFAYFMRRNASVCAWVCDCINLSTMLPYFVRCMSACIQVFCMKRAHAGAWLLYRGITNRHVRVVACYGASHSSIEVCTNVCMYELFPAMGATIPLYMYVWMYAWNVTGETIPLYMYVCMNCYLLWGRPFLYTSPWHPPWP